nr:MAG TPA: hypothetical protein [Caudoviricetes sp.]
MELRVDTTMLRRIGRKGASNVAIVVSPAGAFVISPP